MSLSAVQDQDSWVLQASGWHPGPPVHGEEPTWELTFPVQTCQSRALTPLTSSVGLSPQAPIQLPQSPRARPQAMKGSSYHAQGQLKAFILSSPKPPYTPHPFLPEETSVKVPARTLPVPLCRLSGSPRGGMPPSLGLCEDHKLFL